jgi:hypothetical protein
MQAMRVKINKSDYIKQNLLHSKEINQENERQYTEWEKYLQTMYLIRDEYPKYVRILHNSRSKNK